MLTGCRSSLEKDVQGATDRTTIVRNRNVVFVVDDDPGMLKGLKRLLREHGYDSVVFSSAEEFQNHDDFESACCVVLDINLNNESGIELRHRLRAAGISLPVIYITANDSPACPHGRNRIRLHCLSYKAVPGEVADRADRKGSGRGGVGRLSPRPLRIIRRYFARTSASEFPAEPRRTG